MIVRKRTGFGVPATVEVGHGLLHRVGMWGILLPHPGLINHLLRRGMPQDVKQSLSIGHEFGHLETMALAVPFILWMVAAIGYGARRTTIGLSCLGAVSAWEIAAELYVTLSQRSIYRRAYRGMPYLPRCLFWGGAAAATLAGVLAIPRARQAIS